MISQIVKDARERQATRRVSNPVDEFCEPNCRCARYAKRMARIREQEARGAIMGIAIPEPTPCGRMGVR